MLVCGALFALLATCKNGSAPVQAQKKKRNGTAGSLAIATFAGGCFWCMEPPFEKLDGVVSVVSGFTGGNTDNPTYNQVSSGSTGHAEAIQIEFDPKKVSYLGLLKVFWENIDPTDSGGQFCDRGNQYRSEIFVHGKVQRQLAVQSKKSAAKKLGKAIQTPISDAKSFYPAEKYHQDFYKKDPKRYYSYRKGCGRDARLRELWGPTKH